jgi:hypothetical protein
MCHTIYFSTTLLLYKLDTLLLKQKNLTVLDITGFFFRIRTQVTAFSTSAFTWVLMRKKKPSAFTWVLMQKNKSVISNTGRFFCFNSTASYTCSLCWIDSLSSKSSGRKCSVIFRYKSIRHVWHTGDDKR